MKNCDHGAAVSSAKVPQRPEFKLNRQFLFFAASALNICILFGLTQPTRAAETPAVERSQLALADELALPARLPAHADMGSHKCKT